MNTQTHLIMGAALFGRKIPAYAWAGVVGGLLPDIPMLVIVATLKMTGVPNFLIFNVLFYQNWWQIANGLGHSLIFWPLILAVSWLTKGRSSERWKWWLTIISIIAASAITHSIIDMLCHREDAHMHFWPLSWWKFVSPVSYWNPLHYGGYFSAFETLLGIAMAIYLCRAYQSWIARSLLAFAVAFYVAVPVYFTYLQ